MAKTPINHRLGANGGSAYTVPSGKYLVANIYPASLSAQTIISLGGTAIAEIVPPSAGMDVVMPLRGVVFPPGSTIAQSASGTGAMLTGFLYDI